MTRLKNAATTALVLLGFFAAFALPSMWTGGEGL